MSNDNILEAIAGVGNILIDKIDESKKSWNPEANRYSRAFNLKVLLSLMSDKLTHMDTFIFLSMVEAMNSANKIGAKHIKTLGIPRITLWRSKNKLQQLGMFYEFPDGSLMINPKIAILSKHRKDCLELTKIWNKAIPDAVQYKGELDEN